MKKNTLSATSSLFGLYTALITPFKEEGSQIDEAGFLALLDRQVHGGVAGVILFGSTGESCTVKKEEKKRLIQLAASYLKGSIALFVCVHSGSTECAAAFAKEAASLGAAGLMLTMPPYNRPTQEGLYQHISAVLNATSLPVVLYNAPSRTGCNLEPETLKRLMHFPHLLGIKECSGSISQAAACLQNTSHREPAFHLISGDDVNTLSLMALGATGLISVASNLFPRALSQLVAFCAAGDFHSARLLHNTLLPLFQALFFETNPIPIKEAMQYLNLPSGGCRLPLTAMSPKNKEQLHLIVKKTFDLLEELECE